MNVNLIIVSYLGCFAYEMKAHPKLVFASTLIPPPPPGRYNDCVTTTLWECRAVSKNQNCRLTALVGS